MSWEVNEYIHEQNNAEKQSTVHEQKCDNAPSKAGTMAFNKRIGDWNSENDSNDATNHQEYESGRLVPKFIEFTKIIDPIDSL